ncbi:MAG: hypothetical protein COU07_02480 [Candidatus Harrisonbacteria bacterium CG10_big_fil_rev_8_21_14_0_10_40_38]|uniref:Peptidase M19 n=1 Tax=Candidatus Harrisonbacteria bacterium CG10_big_fil_rev_8_21_14_0_10_40_38 TaxID=1974583 RepID=A0A2H0URZ3_9BACT|nr:MAG: hypothetical protein COU07_02480 [Candidatus Harrisonbacteria bacterium CG10_big_fil_rev_8_21_14_0_10_40_38]
MARKADMMVFFDSQMKPVRGEEIEVDPRYNLDLACVTAAPPMGKWASSTYDVLLRVDRFGDNLVDQDVYIANSREDLISVGRKAILCLQHTPQDISQDGVRKLFRVGVRMMTIAYNGETPFGGGFKVPNVPLTDAGKELIRWFGESGMILDLSHAGHQTARDALNFIEESDINIRVVASHGGVFEKYPNPRNLPMELLRRIVEMGGLVGVYALTFGLTGEDHLGGFSAFLDHLSYLFGELRGFERSICIGTDAVYRERPISEWKGEFDVMAGSIPQGESFPARFPDTSYEFNTPRLFDIVEHEVRDAFPNFSDGILGENMFRFFSEALPR